MQDQITRYRADTPGCENVLHFNNAGASLMPTPVFDAVTGHLTLERDIGGYEAKERAGKELDRFYTAFAELLNAEREEIAYIENATRAWDMAFYSLPLKEGDRILTHECEYASNYLAFLQIAKRRGVHVDLVPSDASGQIDTQALEAAIMPDTRLIAITHVPTQGGLVNPAEEVGRIAQKHGILYLLDACQSVGQIDLDVKRIGCDILTGTGRKFLRGPRGTGFLFIRRELCETLEPVFIDLHAARWTSDSGYELLPDARRFENWESFVAGRIGLARAVDYALDIGMPVIETRVTSLAAHLRDRMRDIRGISLQDQGVRQCGIVTFTKESETPEQVRDRLRAKQINISVSAATSARLDLDSRGLAAVARASVHYFNNEEEIERFCKTLAGRD